MHDPVVWEQLGVALLLGLLVGLQRERVAEPLAGLRTFPLVTMLGTLAALVDDRLVGGGWMLAAGLVGVAAMAVIGNLRRVSPAQADWGTTTEAALLLMYLVGAYVVVGDRTVAVAVGVGCAVLLEFKPELHGVVARLRDSDIRAVFQFALITFVVLPILPDRHYGPPGVEVFNPREAWLMVVLIVGINLGGYALYKYFGNEVGLLLAGVLGGLVSSTATTLSYARRTQSSETAALPAALVITVASATVYLRLLTEVAVIAPGFLLTVAAPFGLMCGTAVLAAGAARWRSDGEPSPLPELANPSELKSAVTMGLLFALVLFALAAGKHYLGVESLWGVAALAGLSDTDAITLSTARLVRQADQTAALDPATGWRLIVVGVVANLAFKLGLASFWGSPRLRNLAAWMLGIQIAAGLTLLAGGRWLDAWLERL